MIAPTSFGSHWYSAHPVVQTNEASASVHASTRGCVGTGVVGATDVGAVVGGGVAGRVVGEAVGGDVTGRVVGATAGTGHAEAIHAGDVDAW